MQLNSGSKDPLTLQKFKDPSFVKKSPKSHGPSTWVFNPTAFLIIISLIIRKYSFLFLPMSQYLAPIFYSIVQQSTLCKVTHFLENYKITI